MEEPSWSNFRLFGGRLNGPDAFATWNTKMVSLSRPFIRIVDTDKLCMIQALDFLNVKDKPEDHGITGDFTSGEPKSHTIHSWKRLEAQNKSAPKGLASQSIMEPIEVRCHGARQSVRDFDSAIAYIFSVQAMLAGDATSEGDFIPSILVLCKMFEHLIAHITGQVPSTFCLCTS